MNTNEVPEVLLRALMHSDYDKGEAKYSATGLISPPQARVLQLRHPEECKQEPWDRLYAILGTAIHSIMERQIDPAKHVAEERITDTFEGVKVSGCPDVYDTETLTLFDYKTCATWAYGSEPKREWVLQTNIYACLLRRAGRDVQRIQIIALFRDWMKTKTVSDTYPPRPFHIFDIPVLDHYLVEAYIAERVRVHEAAEKVPDTDLPECTGEERWMAAAKWVIQKPGSRPWRSFYTEDEARAFLAGMKPATAAQYQVVYTAPVPKRCSFYCVAAPLCQQYQRELAAGIVGGNGNDEQPE